MIYNHFQLGMKNTSVDWKDVCLVQFGRRGSAIKHEKFQ